ncbi:MAG: TadE/TadG family type IV pilus assembly protein [Hyphomicrobiaceae bacterium]
MPAKLCRAHLSAELLKPVHQILQWRPQGDFLRDECGNIVLIFAALLLPLVAVSIGALDYGRANAARHQLQTAINAGLSFAAKQSLENDVEMEAAFRRAFTANLPEAMRSASTTFHADTDGRLLEASASLPVSVHVLGVLNGNRMVVEANGAMNVAAPVLHAPSSKQPSPEFARPIEASRPDIEATEAQIRALLEAQLPREPMPYMDRIDPAEAERLARQILQQLGQ